MSWETITWLRGRFESSRYVLAIIILFFGFAVRELWQSDTTSLTTKAIMTGAFVVLVLLQVDVRTIFEKAKREKEEAQHLVRDVQRESQEALEILNGLLTERGLLLKNVTKEIADVLTDIIEEIGTVTLQATSQAADPALRRGTLINRILKRICDTFDRYRVGEGKERLENTFFKATLFELVRNTSGRELLIRKYWHYPPTKTPATTEIDIADHPNACAVICYRWRRIIVLQNIKEEHRKEDDEGKRWADLRPGQHSEYEAMICVPVMWRERGSDEVFFIGVITIDTNRSGFFRDTEEDKEFLNQILAPFLRAIEICYALYPRYVAQQAGERKPLVS